MATKKPSTALPKKTTLETDYNQQAKIFATDYKQLPAKKKKLRQLQAQYEQMSAVALCDMTTDEINNYHIMRNEIAELEKNIESSENMTDMTDFYLKTGQFLITYFDNVNMEGNEKKKGRPAKASTITPGLTSEAVGFGGFLKIKSSAKPPSEDPTKEPAKDIVKAPVTEGGKTLISMIKTNSSFQRADIYDQYSAATDPHYVAPMEYSKSEDFCSDCGEYRELINQEAILVCPSCGDEVSVVMESDKPSYKDPPHENMYFAYKRINHFKEQLSHFQAKETTKIPQEVYDVILVEFKKEKRANLAYLTRSRVKKYLQKYTHLNYNKYYENINQIICHLNGMQPLSMPPEVEDQLCNMFLKIQDPFEKHCPPGRTNFLSYSYVIHKFCQLLGYDEYLPYFNLLKSKDKLHQQDKIWKKVSQDVGWKYYPSSH
jgi:hypothetical protein